MAEETKWWDAAPAPDAAPAGAGTPVKPNWWDKATPVQGATGTQKAAAVVGGITGGAVEAGAMLGGAIMGGQIGALGGPAAPVTIPLGILAGGAAGALAGRGIRRAAAQVGAMAPPAGELTPELRSFGFAGEAVGGAVPFAGAPIALAQAGYRLAPSLAGNFINRIIETAGRTPGSFTAIETGAAATAGIAGGIAEAVAPGETGRRVLAEVGGGMLSPTRLIATHTVSAATKLKDFVTSMSATGRQTRAGRQLLEFVEAAGEDPDALIALLRQTDIPEVAAATAAQKTGSPALAAFEAELGELNRKFGAEATRQARESLEAISASIQLLRGTGDPDALRMAADLRATQFRTMIELRLQDATDEARTAAGAISRDTPMARAELSRQAEATIGRSLDRARQIERSLWSAVPDTTPVRGNNVFEAWDLIRGQVVARKQFVATVQGTIEDLQSAQNALIRAAEGAEVGEEELATATQMFTVRRMLQLRNEALDASRFAAAQPGGANDARVYGNIAEAVLADLEAAGAAGAGTALDDARTFSRELNDTFTRTFAGAARASVKTGAERVPPELLLKRALATGDELGALQLDELEEAVRFLPARGLGGEAAERDIGLMLDAQERLVRIAASAAVDPLTGKASPARLAKFMNESGLVLDKFPNVRADLEAAVTSEQGFKAAQDQVKRASRFLEQRAAIGRVLKVENPANAVRGAIRSTHPTENLVALARMARKGGVASAEGFRASVWDDAIRSSQTPAGNVSLRDLSSALMDPIRPDGQSVTQIMVQEGVLPLSAMAQIGKLASRARMIADAEAAVATGEPILGGQDWIVDTALRVAGSHIGTFFARGGGTGTSLIAAQRGSMAARALFDRIPAGKVQTLLANALRGDPLTPTDKPFSLLAALLEKTADGTKGIAMAQQIHAYAVQAGLTYATEGLQP